jgi:ferrochelatase
MNASPLTHYSDLMSKGVLLVNLGSPDSPSVPDVRRYLREFLMDGRVLDLAWPVRFCLVNFGILRSRPKESAEAYHKIWMPEGSPLVATSRNLKKKLQARLEVPVELAMRYQKPSIPDAINAMASKGIDDVLLIPLFPHYAMSSFETAVVRVQEVAAEVAPRMKITVQPPFYRDEDYVSALVAASQDYLKKDFDHLLFSFHGIPERHIKKSDTTGQHCLTVPNCCEVPSPAHSTCYRHQCFQTMAAFVKKSGIPKEKYSLSFQSRLLRDPWLRPYTDYELERLAKEGVRKLIVISPAFVADCLETIEELGMRGKESFLGSGGKEFTLIPCMNEHPLWIDALTRMVTRFTG